MSDAVENNEKQKRRSRATPVSVFGEVLITIGVVLFLFAFYEAYWTNIEAGKAQDEVNSALDSTWSNPRTIHNPALGEAFARIYIPSFGTDFHFAIVEGTSDADLLKGPGHYSTSQMPGEAGNFAVAGHRVGKGAPFNDLGNLNTCDSIIIETQTAWYTYKVLPIDGAAPSCFTPEQQSRISSGDYASVDGRSIVYPDAIGVISPLPDTDAALSDSLEPLITLTTCHPQFSNAQRMIIHGMLVSTMPKNGDDKPAELEAS
ncbi:MAG: class E sortase [Corynebacterium sp.]|nr:class E sortase [Corynebacterium sp.]